MKIGRQKVKKSLSFMIFNRELELNLIFVDINLLKHFGRMKIKTFGDYWL